MVPGAVSLCPRSHLAAAFSAEYNPEIALHPDQMIRRVTKQFGLSQAGFHRAQLWIWEHCPIIDARTSLNTETASLSGLVLLKRPVAHCQWGPGSRAAVDGLCMPNQPHVFN